MKLVRFISEESPEKLQESINIILREIQDIDYASDPEEMGIVLDIKISVSTSQIDSVYAALIIYKVED